MSQGERGHKRWSRKEQKPKHEQIKAIVPAKNTKCVRKIGREQKKGGKQGLGSVAQNDVSEEWRTDRIRFSERTGSNF